MNEFLEGLKRIPDDLRKLPDDKWGLRDKVCTVIEGYIDEMNALITAELGLD